MQTTNRLRAALTSGRKSFGAWQMLPGTNLSRCMSRSGIDWICVDTEHGNIDDAHMHEAVQAISSTGVSPVVRVAADEGWMIKRALDAGAHGIIVPLLRTQADAQKVVRASKFPPLGIRGFGSPFSMNAFVDNSGRVPSSLDYLRQANNSLLTIIQIETREALDNVEAIAKTEGVDVLLVGPFDLGNSGHPIDGEMDIDLKQAIEKIRTTARDRGKFSAMYCTSGAQGRAYADLGFDMISVTGDVLALQNYVSQQFQEAQGVGTSSGTSAGTQSTGPYGK